MKNNYLLKYKTFDELMADVRADLKMYNTNGMIDDAELIKIAMYINRKLGNKLRQVKETILYVEKGRVRLPEDFHKLEIALTCYGGTSVAPVMRGDQREYIEVCNQVLPDGCDPCPPPVNPCVRLTECGREYAIIEVKAYESVRYNSFARLNISYEKYCSPLYSKSVDESYAYINGKFLYTGFDEGTVYMSYLGQMEDEEGNLLVLDHDLINPYYEYAIKRRILENLYLSGEDVVQKMNLVETRYTEAKNEASTIINTPDKAEMDLFHDLNRKAMHRKFYSMF